MSSLYDCEVLTVDGATAQLRVRIIHPDVSTFPESGTFALLLITDPVHHWELQGEPHVLGSPIAGVADLDDLLNEQWMVENAAGFVRWIEMIDAEHFPPPSWDDPEAYEAFWDGEDRPTAIYELEVTHPGWLEHLRSGMRWETSAYDMGRAADWEGPTRAPGDRVLEWAPSAADGFRPLAANAMNSAYIEQRQLRVGGLLPIRGARYYGSKELREAPVSSEILAELEGEPVVLQTEDDRIVGLLSSLQDGLVYVYYERDSSCGLTGIGPQGIVSIGRAWFLEERPRDDD